MAKGGRKVGRKVGSRYIQQKTLEKYDYVFADLSRHLKALADLSLEQKCYVEARYRSQGYDAALALEAMLRGVNVEQIRGELSNRGL